MAEESNKCFMDEDSLSCAPEDGINHRCILLLIELYKTYRPKVGRIIVKTLKKMWEIICEKMNSHGYNFIPTRVENQWKVLERNYKKMVDNNNKTGRAHKIFPYQVQFDEIYKQKVNLHPKLLLSSDTQTAPTINECPSLSSTKAVEISQTSETIPSTSDLHVSNITISTAERKSFESKKTRKRAVTYQTRNEILKEMKNNLKHFYDRKISLEKEKVEIKRQKLELDQSKLKTVQEHMEELKRFNNVWANKENVPRNPFL